MGVVKEQDVPMEMDADIDMERLDHDDGRWWMKLRQWFGMDGGRCCPC